MAERVESEVQGFATGESGGMNEDLRWSARYVTEWSGDYTHVYRIIHEGTEGRDEWARFNDGQGFTRKEWQAARDELEDGDCRVCGGVLGAHFNTCSTLPEDDHYKQPRYQDSKGEDWIDEFARTATPEEFRGAMRFTIGKYVRRVGKKDALESEIKKIRDYSARWLEVEKGR